MYQAHRTPEGNWLSDPVLQSIIANLRRHIRKSTP